MEAKLSSADIYHRFCASARRALFIVALDATLCKSFAVYAHTIVVIIIAVITTQANYFIVIKSWFITFSAAVKSFAAVLARLELVVVELCIIFAIGAHVSARFGNCGP